MEGDGGAGWERLLEAQSEYIASLQRMLQSACQNAASMPPGPDGAPPVNVGDVRACNPQDGPPGGSGAAAAQAALAAAANAGVTLGAQIPPAPPQPPPVPRPPQPLPADEGAGSYALDRHTVVAESFVTEGVAAGSPSVSSQPAVPNARWQKAGDGDGGGGYPAPRAATSQTPANPVSVASAPGGAAGQVSESAGTSVSIVPSASGVGGSLPESASLSNRTSGVDRISGVGEHVAGDAVPPVGGLAARYEETANEVLRLRLQKSQHDELRAQLTRAEGQLRRLSPQTVFQFRNYLERHFREVHLASQVQDTLVRLIESLCAICRIEVGPGTPANLLNAIRKLFRDSHSFTSRLCNLPHATSEEVTRQAKGLAPFLLPGAQFRKVREKEVNECYEAFHGWLSAFYLYSVVFDQIGPTEQALERQEWQLRRLSGQADGAEAPRQSASSLNASVSSASMSASTGTASLGASTGAGTHVPAAPARNANAAAAAAGPRVSRAPGVSRGGVSSPLGGRGRAAPQSSPNPPRSSPVHTRPRVSTGAELMGNDSRSPSPGTVRAHGNMLRQRFASGGGGGVSPSSAFGTSSARLPGRGGGVSTTAGPASVSGPAGSPYVSTRRDPPHVAAGNLSVSVSVPPAPSCDDAPVGGGTRKSPAGSPGLTRVQSERALGTSPRTGRKNDSRSPSPGTGRASPSAPPPRAMHSTAGSTRVAERLPATRREDTGIISGRRAMSPSQSENTLQRMSSAPTDYGRSVRSKASGASPVAIATTADRGGRQSASGRHSIVSSSRTASRQVARPMSPDKCGGPPRNDAGVADETPQSSAEASARRQTASASCSDDEDGDGGFGPRRRRLSAVQYEALVRCAQQVVAVSSMPPQHATSMNSHAAPPGQHQAH